MKLMQGAPPPPGMQVSVADWRAPGMCRWSFSHVRQLLPTAPMPSSVDPTGLPEARQDLSSLPVTEDGTELAAFLAGNGNPNRNESDRAGDDVHDYQRFEDAMGRQGHIRPPYCA